MKLKKKIASLAIAGALVLSGLGAVQSAQADLLTPGTLTLVSGNGSSGASLNGSNTDTYFLNSVATSVGGPVGFRAASTSQIFQGGVLVGNISNLRTTAMAVTAGTNGLDGNPAFMDRSVIGTNNFVSNKKLDNAALSTLVSGNFEYRYYFHASSTSLDFVNDKYLSITLTYDATAGTWALPAAPAAPTSTSLTASASGTDVTLSATVTPSSAPGTVTFLEGVTPVATGIAIVAGVASTVLAGVSNGPHTYTAQFVPTNPAAFTGSTSLGASVTVGAITAPGSSPSNITVIVPTGVGNLFLTSSSASVALGTATLNAGTLNASGTLNAVVTDQRQIGSGAWNLTGLVGNFARTAPATPAASIAGTYLGWTPAVAAGSAPGSGPGVQVLPSAAAGGGLMSSRILALGNSDLGGGVTTASALLALAAPANTAAGTYSATLTLTLI